MSDPQAIVPGMDLTWVWAAVAAVAAVASAVWSVMQAVQSRSPFTRYQQWMVIAKDHVENPAVHEYAEERVRAYVVILASRSRVARTRRKQWVAAIAVIAFALVLPLLGARSDGFSTFLGILIAAILVGGDIRVAWIRRQTYRRLYPDLVSASRKDSRAAKPLEPTGQPGASPEPGPQPPHPAGSLG